VHPRLGVVDVLPIIPVLKAKMADAVRIARFVGTEVEARYHVPVYFYEYAALQPELRNLADVRRLKRYNKHHPTAGAICVGARDYLVAYNINLSTPDIEIAKKIASQLREKNGGLPGVKALGLYLEKTHTAQVSMNLVDPLVTTPQMVYERVAELSTSCGVMIKDEEYIGLTPYRVIAAAQQFEQELE
jgi:glutamate formiminotransferase